MIAKVSSTENGGRYKPEKWYYEFEARKCPRKMENKKIDLISTSCPK